MAALGMHHTDVTPGCAKMGAGGRLAPEEAAA